MKPTKTADTNTTPATGTISDRIPKKRIFEFQHLNEWLDGFRSEQTIKSNTKIIYYNTPVALDFETSSFYEGDDKRAVMYMWTMARRADILRGRTWEELEYTVLRLSEDFGLDPREKRVIIYIHNLGFEFQFMRKHFNWKKVFSVKERAPLYALTDTGVEFRCSYRLTNYSLAAVGDNLVKWECRKMLGDLDYSLIRHAETPITEEERGYTDNDVLIITCLIDEKIEEAHGNISLIPLTQTGYVRRYCKQQTLRKGKYLNSKYARLVRSLTLTPEKYELLKLGFQGGFTHGNAYRVGKVWENVGSYDRTSAYPTECCREHFPMDSGEFVTINSPKEFYQNLRRYCCCFQIEFYGLESITDNDHPLSSSKCLDLEHYLEDNGRIVSAARAVTVITEQDFDVFRHFYKWEHFKVGKFLRFKKAYLPRELILAILSLYKTKTGLKGVKGSEREYMNSKEKLNAVYGMMVTDICRPEYEYKDDEWSVTPPDLEKEIEKYNNAKGRFLYYAWGIWVTAYARRSLFLAIYALGNDYIYADTDSVKYVNVERHRAYFERANATNLAKLRTMCEFYKIPLEMVSPKTIKGKVKTLGEWDFEGVYDRFKTLGAKRYMIQQPDALTVDEGLPTEKKYDYSLTVSGLRKSACIPWLLENVKGDLFDAFDDSLKVPAGFSGRQTHTYIDYETEGVMTDYLGKKLPYRELSGVHIETSEYSLSIGRLFREYLESLGGGEEYITGE